ncbi:MAG TPA: SusD/RagB family nutrient-binding outer membrane lipoprotein [Prolixibacteraceae bacterium]|mgnify:CR=1 FL=1|nr:SusD/RagB family nutrient-binding outer membrane lipoprotein [Prolixibacteraceae bacterium]HRV89574.1 SusD/RagB family nutrient-binding outer membrane lipoprotein [Prolixibacteraceae bacterium]
MKRLKIILGITLIVSLLSGCDNFEDINTNPDTTTQVSASMICTNIVLRMTRFSGRDAKVLVAENALPKYVGYANEGQMGEQYNKIGGSSFEGMTMLPNIDKMLEYAEGSVMADSYKGIASLAKAYMFFRLTMEMGDIPYSETNKGADGLYRPKYDTQEEVFRGVLDELKLADQYFAAGNRFDGDPTPYNGDPAKWRRATNALAIKVLMTLSKKESVASLDIKNRFAAIVASGQLLEANTGFLGLNYSSQNKHPLSGTNDLFTSRTVISSLLIDNLKNLNDRRMYYFAEPAGAQIAAGKTADDPEAYVGLDVSIDYATMNAGHSANLYSLLNKRYLTEEATEPRMVMTYAEQQLILAEARIRGWITSGTAIEYYESGVKSALAAVGATKASYAHGKPIDQAYINGYFTGEAAFKTAPEDQLKQIWMQRYLLQFMQDAQSSYFEYRRHGFPVFPINPATSLNENNKNGLPLRWLYPSSETNYNRENLEAALQRQYEGYDEINKIMWLLK